MIFDGVLKVLKGDAWESEFDLSPKGLPRSFIAVALYIPLSFVIARAAVKYNAVEGYVPYPEIALILVLIAMTFPLIAYTLCSIFNKLENFRPWVITRNWSVLFVMAAMAAAFGLYVIGLLPFSVAFYIGMFFYLGTLAVDIRLAMRAGGFDWFGAVFAGVLITVSSMLVLLLGLAQALD